MEELAIDSDVSDDLERLTNLFSLLQTAVRFEQLDAKSAKLDERASRLSAALEKLAQDTARPNNSSHARSLGLMLRLAVTADPQGDPADLDELWSEFRQLIKDVEGLATFPFEPIADALTSIGETFNSQAFDQLFEDLTDALVKRRCEGEAAKRNAERGFQKLKANLPYDAIRWFGRAVGLLTKDEYQEELVDALIGSSMAYQCSGLHWAARNYALAAASQELQEFRRTDSLNGVNPGTLTHWMSTELALGRVPYVIAAHELAAMVRFNRSVTASQKAFANERLTDADMGIGALLLRARFEDLKSLACFPDSLERLRVPQSRVALLYLMGQIRVLRDEGSIPPEETDASADEFFQHWFSFGQQMALPDHPDFMLSDRVDLRSRVLGCEVTINCVNNLTSISIGEALLGALEALLATSLGFQILPHLDHLRLRVDPVMDADLVPKINFIEEEGMPVGVITHRADIHYKSYEDACTFPDWLQTAVVETFTQFAVPAEVEQWSAEILENERAFSRALTFSNIPNMMSLLFGNTTKVSLADRRTESDRRYVLMRAAPWQPIRTKLSKTRPAKPPKFGNDVPPPGMFDLERLKHTDIRVVSPIDIRKWNSAAWQGVFFQVIPGHPDYPPVLGIAFENIEAGEAIFRGFRGRFGLEDAHNELRIAIIRGARISNPHAYALSIGANMNRFPEKEGKIVEFGSRNHILTSETSENLERFLESYRLHRRYLLVPAKFNGPTSPPEPSIELAIGKYELEVMDAWRIGPNNPDAMILDHDDPPVIPMDCANPPALKAMEWLDGLRTARKACSRRQA